MNLKRIMSAGLVLIILLSCIAVPAWADRNSRDDEQRRDNARYYTDRGYVLDNRYNHNHYYPPRGYTIHTYPPRYRLVPYGGINYYFSAGVWYRPSGLNLTVVLPPIGIRIPVLPEFYTTIWVGGIPYYYAGGVYYTWLPQERVYVVTAPPSDTQVTQAPATPDELFVYPKQGQTAEQQAKDRYECHRWAVEQTGFDPTQPGGNVDNAQYAGKRADYQRATKTCLEARGYSVQ